MITVEALAAYLEEKAPLALAESWDNCGVLVRGGEETVTGVLCALDVTPDTVREAHECGCNVLLSHHPVIFHPLRALAAQDVPSLLVRARITAVCMHTNLDKASGGVNDVLAAALALHDVETFADGLGRIGMLESPASACALAERVGSLLCTPVRYADAGGCICRVAVVSGAGGELAARAAKAGAQCLVTGEASHHHAIDALAAGASLIAATHFATEIGIVPVLALGLRAAFPALPVYESKTQRDPFRYLVAR